MKTRSRRLKRALEGAGISVVLGTLVSVPAHAQEAAADQAAEGTLSEIIVTASRVRREGFEAPTPTTVLGGEILEKLGTTDVASALNQMPAFQADQNASTNTLSANAGRRYANLRNLGSQRTLVLVDGRRTTPSSLTGQTDLNAIPQVLIDRIDVVTGGASAQWGSDAVSGVVNMVTKKSLVGFETDFSYGITQEGDGETYKAAVAFGTDFADGRGHFIVGGEYVTSEGVDDMYARDWGRQEWGFVNNVNFATNGLPKIFVLPNVRRNQLAAGGLIVSGPLAGTTFDANGEPRPFVFGSVNGSGTHSGGDGYAEDDGQGTPLEVPLDRGAGQMRLSFELTPDTEVFAEASYGYLYTAGVGPSPIDYNGTGLVIRDDNPYIPAALRQRMTDLGVTSFSLARYWKDDMNGDSVRLARPRTISENTSRSYTLGASGTLGSGWSWDVTSQYGATDQEYVGRGYRIQQRFYQSADAVVDPVSGEIVCRSTLTNPDNGCVPVNLFGRNAVSQEAWDYFTGTQRTRTTYHRTVHAANVHGEPFSTWAGDVSMALGLEYRKDRARMTQKEPLALARAFNYGNAQPIDGSIDVKEGYLEAVIPLAKDVKFVESLEFDGAVRATDYSTSGTVNTWKAGLNWTITDSVRFRGSVSRDIRAPNISELYTSVSQGILNAINPETGGNLTVTTLSSGNVDLEPEKARTYTGGFVFTPSFVPNLKLSFDYYDIEIDGVITSISGQTVINYCYEGVASFCSLIDSTSQATAIVRLPFLNLAGLKVKGWDVEAAYGFDLGAGRLDLNLFGTYQPEILVDNGTSAPIDRAGDMGRAGAPYGGPKWKWNAIAGYTVDNFSAALSVRYVGSGKKDVTYTAADIDNNKVDSATYVTLSLGYELPNVSGMDLRLYADVHNLLNEDPPVNPYSSSGYPYNPTFHDPIGRRFTVGVTAKF